MSDIIKLFFRNKVCTERAATLLVGGTSTCACPLNLSHLLLTPGRDQLHVLPGWAVQPLVSTTHATPSVVTHSEPDINAINIHGKNRRAVGFGL